MWLKKIRLTNFRNYSNAEFDFSSQTTAIIGPNASGKTNLLEAIFLLASGESFKADTSGQMLTWDKDYAVIEGKVAEGKDETSLLIQLKKENGTTRKTFLIDGRPVLRKEFLNVFYAVEFRPEDIRLVSGSPDRRRDFVDKMLSGVSWRYRQSLRLYRRALKQRNQLLDLIRENQSRVQELFFWDNTLVKNSAFLIEERQKLVSFINRFLAASPHHFLSQISILYRPNSATLAKLKNNLRTDIQTGWTNCGPHKDLLVIEGSEFRTADKNIAFWGSRAQQRLAVLGLRLAQIEHIFQLAGKRPALLLDDIFSELDEEQQKLLTSFFVSHQIIVTAATLPADQTFSWQAKIDLSSRQQ